MDFLLAYVAGLLTLINPCVLPLIPLIAAGAVSRHPLGPAALAAGMAVTFTLAGLTVFGFARAVGLSPGDITVAAGLVMVGFGLVLLVPRAEAAFSRLAGAAAGGGTRLIMRTEGRGLWGEALAGGLLGLAWSPCIGPTLGAAIGFAAQGENIPYAGAIMLAFAAGAATVVLALSYGARSILAGRRSWLSQFSPYAKPVLGVGLVIVGLAIVFHLDRAIEAWAIETLPAWFTDLSVSI
jgi:cytochrome c-type biogenesis protein